MFHLLIGSPISGASMNPARTIGSAVAGNKYTSIWIYMVAPVLGSIIGAISYNMIRLNDKPVRELTKSGSFLRASAPADPHQHSNPQSNSQKSHS